MNELLNHVTERTGLSPDQAQAAVEAVVGFLKQRLPPSLAGILDSLVAGSAGGATIGGEGLAGEAVEVLEHLLGPKR